MARPSSKSKATTSLSRAANEQSGRAFERLAFSFIRGAPEMLQNHRQLTRSELSVLAQIEELAEGLESSRWPQPRLPELLQNLFFARAGR
jgi:hypothetical protein